MLVFYTNVYIKNNHMRKCFDTAPRMWSKFLDDNLLSSMNEYVKMSWVRRRPGYWMCNLTQLTSAAVKVDLLWRQRCASLT